MVRIAVFGNCPEGRKAAVEGSLPLLAASGTPFIRFSPLEMIPREGEPPCTVSDICLQIDLRALASDIVTEMPYSFPEPCDVPANFRSVSEVVEDRAIGRSYRVFLQDRLVRRYDAVIYLDSGLPRSDSGIDLTGLGAKESEDWKMFEKYRLRALCRRSSVMYSSLRDPADMAEDLAKRARNVRDSVR